MNRILVTGGVGFIGSALVRHIINNTQDYVTVIDGFTYAGNLRNIRSVYSSLRITVDFADICNNDPNNTRIPDILNDFKPTHIIHLAAETHVDNSIDDPSAFINTNIVGTFNLLEATRNYFNTLTDEEKRTFRFHHVSTDEVYGDLGASKGSFTEASPYAPSSPYSASKAASDHLVRAWGRTYGLPVIITNCSNNYGEYQFPEKLIPKTIMCALHCQRIPVYGDGSQIRDWLYVQDHVEALYLVATSGTPMETYNIGGNNERSNIEIVRTICTLLDELSPRKDGRSYTEQITFVKDRAGHDKRYAVDASKIKRELGWTPKVSFEIGLRKTIQFYLENLAYYEK